MPRIAEQRAPAEPSSPVQKDRHQRILRAAATLGAEHGLERVQMADIAAEAGVAIATLYRYFPSKTALFIKVLGAQVAQLDRLAADYVPGSDRAEQVAAVLVRAGEGLLARPRLTHAMLTSNNAAVAGEGGGTGGVTTPFQDLLLRVAGVAEPSPMDVRLMRLVEQAWYGILISVLNHHIDADQAAEDTRLACQRLLVGLGD